MGQRSFLIGPIVLTLATMSCPSARAATAQANISGLRDVAFGVVSNFTADQAKSQNLCVYSSGTGGQYNVTATGSGASGAFTLASGTRTLAYEVQWAASTGQSTGTALRPGVALTGLTSTATQSKCTTGPASSASLITIIRTAVLNTASAGTYQGSLTLLIAPN